ncbi:T9SS type A sorting domain-containing protein [Fulvivirga sp. 29W222]|uniref:T9SS type A sorting domain-containing protein n=1 Tax=Fulvivirga marina TaxID=2494733 RepID=A0A937FUY7_9BACT|nr:T9SS type A sorting domain-containing protein [Fulvivirga marina]MBL6445417.1 T9SS type A sorting domain-containing protein [Fulvivirga marina]
MKYILIIFTLALSFGALAQAPDWQVNPADYEYSMTFTGIVSVDTVENINAGSQIAAWVGNELRGTSDPIYVSATGRYYYQLLVYANTSGEVVTFSFYNADNDQVIDLENTEAFISDKNTGSFSDPYIFRNWENTTFNSFSFVGFDAEATINASTQQITITLPENTNVTNLVAEYQFDHAISVQVDGTEQESGVTANNFTSQVKYDISTGTHIYTWTVKVSVENTAITGLSKKQEAQLIIYPNPASDALYVKNLDGTAEYEILDSFGKLVMNGKLTHYVNVQGLTPGIYFIKVNTAYHEVRMMKWVKN